MLEIINIHKSYGKNNVLKGINLSVAAGDIMTIIGPSGSGKTTLLRCINFLERAEKGELIIGDIKCDFKRASNKEILAVRKKTAMVFQSYNLFNNKTALENIMEGLVVGRKIPKSIALEKSRNVLEKVGLSEKADSYPSQLSGGQQQRIGIARALVLNPEVILMDEPTSSLDPELVAEVLDVIRDVAQEGITMLIVTHEISFAKDISNRLVFIDEGHIVEEGSPSQIIENPNNERTRQFLNAVRKVI